MTAPTHIVGGIGAMSFISLLIPAYRLSLVHLIVGAIASMLPDLDNPKSFIGRIFFLISNPIDRKFGHRTITHSLLALFILSGASYLSLYIVQTVPTVPIVFTIAIAYFSHLFLDAMTKQGIQLYYPSRVWGVFPARASWRIRSGSKGEALFFIVFLAAALVFFPLGQSGVIQTFNRLFLVHQTDIKLRELQAKKQRAAGGFSEEQIDSLLSVQAIDPKQASELKNKLIEADLQIEKFKIDHGVK